MAYKVMGTTASPFYSDMMIYYIMCDTPADLPSTISDIGYGTTIGYGSRADIISDSSKYIWNGSQWVRQTTGGGGGASSADQVSYDNTDSGLTATNVQDAIDKLKDTDDMQDRALAELYGMDANQQLEINYAINTGAKNLFKNDKNAGATVVKQGATWVFDQTSVIAKVSGNVSTTWSDVYLLNSNLDLSDKEYTIVVESDNPNLYVYIPGNTLSGDNIPSNGQYYHGVYKYKGIMTTSTRFTAKTASYSDNTIKCMICPASITDTTFQPYAPTNRELYETKVGKEDVAFTDKWGYVKPTIGGTGDFNTIVSSGYYRYNGAPANAPTGATGEFGILMVFAAGSYISQIAHCMLSSQFGIYIRHSSSTGSVWTAWTKLAETQVANVQSVSPSLMLNREEITPLETDIIKETEEAMPLETDEIEETE